jgi:serine O-acetyltransferase
MSESQSPISPNEPVHAQLREVARRIASRCRTPGNPIPAAHNPLPSAEAASEIMDHCRRLLMPGFFGGQNVHPDLIEEYLAELAEKTQMLLTHQIARCLRHNCNHLHTVCDLCRARGEQEATAFMRKLPRLREWIEEDVRAAYDGDPAAKSFDEVIFSYPSIMAVLVYRCAHELHVQEVPLLPRLMTELAHARTGIDIHPGAVIGRRFFIDHGTGVVIGETCVIGNDVKMYQGATLGALSFPKDACGALVRGTKRHPTLEDGVTVYAGATILGGDTVIGRGSVIGGNVWITQSIPPGTKVILVPPDLKYRDNPDGPPPPGALYFHI